MTFALLIASAVGILRSKSPFAVRSQRGRPRLQRKATIRRPIAEAVEDRFLLAYDLSFSSTSISGTIGNVDEIAIVADVTGDGVPEYFIQSERTDYGSFPDNGMYRVNEDTGKLELVTALPSRDVNMVVSMMAVADLDQDGDLDLIRTRGYVTITSYAERLEYLQNLDGRGTWGDPRLITAGAGYIGVEMSDVDQDGDLDFAYTHELWPGRFYGWSENQGGTFVDHKKSFSGPLVPMWNLEARFDADGDGAYHVQPILASRNQTWSADLDGDGRLDILSSTGYWQKLTITGTLERGEPLSSFLYADRVEPEDIDRDGDVDVWVQSKESLRWEENQGGGKLVEHVFPYTLSGEFRLVQLDDDFQMEILDLDGHIGRLIRYDFDSIAQTVSSRSYDAPGREIAQISEDLNGDGRQDIAGLLGWFEQSADGKWISHRYPDDLRPDLVTSGAFDETGREGLFFYSMETIDSTAYSRLEWAFVQSDGSLSPRQLIGTFHEVVSQLDMFDMDDDGDEDLVAVILRSNETWIDWWENTDGLGKFVGRGSYSTMSGRESVYYGDLDGDHDLDIVRSIGAALYWFERTSQGTFVERRIADVEASRVALADLDGDRDIDLVILEQGILSWYENQSGAVRFSGRAVHPISQLGDVTSIRPMDFNGDGDQDLVVTQRDRIAWNEPGDPDFLPELKYTYHLFDNSNGQGNMSALPNPPAQRGRLDLLTDLNRDDWIDFIESPVALPGIVVSLNTTPSPPADLNRDGVANAQDVDLFCAQYLAGTKNPRLDRNGDGRVDQSDHRALVLGDLQLTFGDANSDGRFNSADLLMAFALGGYENADQESSWEGGDWNCDGRFTSADLVVALQESVYDSQ